MNLEFEFEFPSNPITDDIFTNIFKKDNLEA